MNTRIENAKRIPTHDQLGPDPEPAGHRRIELIRPAAEVIEAPRLAAARARRSSAATQRGLVRAAG